MNGFQQRLILYSSPLTSINVCFRLLTTGWYIVAKGKILSLAFSLEAKITPERDRSMTLCSQALFEFLKAHAKCCF